MPSARARSFSTLNLEGVAVFSVSRAGSIIAFVLFGLSATQELGGQSTTTLSRQSGRGSADLANAKDREAFFDSLFVGAVRDHHVPGLVFTLVKDGRVLFLKGYGYANLEARTPVHPERTRFPVGSLSKLFTTTAVMQLHERGKLDLNRDVNSYLQEFKLDDNFAQPVTMSHLLTHTAGFEHRNIGIAARSESNVSPLGEYLAAHMPPRVQAPGRVYNYSHLGMTLAGYIVQCVSGMPFERYAAEHILRPLGMNRSSFYAAAQSDVRLATGYAYNGREYYELPPVYPHVKPAGGLVTTGADMARFMIAQLGGGKVDVESSRILSEANNSEMKARHFAHHPTMPGSAFGYYEHPVNDVRGLGHEGWIGGHTSYIHLLPDSGLGMFLATNAADAKWLQAALLQQFHDRYYPVVASDSVKQTPRSEGAALRASSIAGVYRAGSFARSGLERVGLVLLSKQIQVTDAGDGTLSMRRDESDVRLTEVEPGLFRWYWKNLPYYVLFEQDAGGRVGRLMIGLHIYERIAWYETPVAQLMIASSLILIFLSAYGALFTASAGRSTRRSPARLRSARDHPARVALLYAAAVCSLNLIFLAGMARHISFPRSHFMAFGLSPVMVALLALPILSSAMAIGMPVFASIAWKRRYWTPAMRLHFSVVTLAVLAFIPLLFHLHLIGRRALAHRDRGSIQVLAPGESESNDLAILPAFSRAVW
ncbi:MAG: serine hydrolase domain-containing protein [Gemmatimonadaceae bacterium]